MKFSFKNPFCKWDQISRNLGTWSYLHIYYKSLMRNFIFCAVWMYKRGMPHRMDFFTSTKILLFSFKNANLKMKMGINPQRRI